MPAKELLFDEHAREHLRSGATQLADVVRITLGPRGRFVVVDKKFGAPEITNDGGTIARQIELADHFENMGAQLVKEVAVKTSDTAGDGTTTSVVLAHRMITEGLRNVTAGADPIALKTGIEKAAEAVVAKIKQLAVPVRGHEQVAQVAGISAADAEVGKLIADAMDKVGQDGVITVEEGQSNETELEIVEGVQFDRGYVSPYFVTDQEHMETVLEDPLILVTDKKLTAVQDLLPVLEKVMQAGKPLLVIAEDIEGEALATLVVNKIRGTLTAVAVKAPAFGERRKAILEDIATVIGGEVMSEELGRSLEDTRLEQLGTARRVTIDKDTTTIVEGGGTDDAIKARAEDIRRQIPEVDSDWDREKLQERLAKLVGGVAVIKVGAPTEVEMKERKHRIEDALAATRAAVEEGIVPGGGVVLLQATGAIDSLQLSDDALTAARVVKRALEEPMRQIAANAGWDGSVVVEKVRGLKAGEGFDALAEKYTDMMQAGIVDPAKVTRTAVQNAASIAGILLTTETLVADAPEEKAAPAGYGHEHDHGDMEDMDF